MRYLVGFVLFLLALGSLRLVGCGGEPELEPEPPECLANEDCDDQYECTADECVGGVCLSQEKWYLNGTPCEGDGFVGICLMRLGCTEGRECWVDEHCADDQNECTDEFCDLHGYLYECRVYTDTTECRPCESDGGGPAVCKGGVCKEAECLADADCNDGDACTYDSCLSCGECSHRATCASDGNACTEDRCDSSTGECSYPALPDGTGCGCLEHGHELCWVFFWCEVCIDEGYCRNGECV